MYTKLQFKYSVLDLQQVLAISSYYCVQSSTSFVLYYPSEKWWGRMWSSLLSRLRGMNFTEHKAKNKHNNTNNLIKYHPLDPSSSVSLVPSYLSVKVWFWLILSCLSVPVDFLDSPLPAWATSTPAHYLAESPNTLSPIQAKVFTFSSIGGTWSPEWTKCSCCVSVLPRCGQAFLHQYTFVPSRVLLDNWPCSRI